MKGFWRNLVLAVILIAEVVLAALLPPDYSQKNFEFLPEMVRQPRFGAFDDNPYFRDGATLRPPVPGTVARGMLPLEYSPSPEDAVRAGRQLANPFPVDDVAAIQRGQAIYRRFCTPCHGPTGQGDGKVAQRGFPPPPRLTDSALVSILDGQMFHAITFGKGSMPAYAQQITREDRWRVILYVRNLQRKAQTSTVAEAP